MKSVVTGDSASVDTRSVPGKTFLIGEYLALEGGPSLIVSTAPRFVLQAATIAAKASSRSQRSLPFAPASPAGRLISRHAKSFSGTRFEFRDPHHGMGGLGASSAQFALLYTWLNKINIIEPSEFDWLALLNEYRACAWSGEGTPPSGADVVAQLVGGISWFDGREHRARRLEWPFRDLSFTLVRTGVKLATHEHLKRSKAAPHEALRDLVGRVTDAFQNANADDFVASIQSAARVLSDAGLTARSTLGLLKAMRDAGDWALAAKGCGAMGADVILVLHEAKRAADVERWVASKDLTVCGRLADLAPGLMVQHEPSETAVDIEATKARGTRQPARNPLRAKATEKI